MSYYSEDELQVLGLKSVGHNVSISKKTSIYNAGNISIGNNVRIDDYCVLSAGEGGICIGSYIHIAVYTSLIGKGSISLQDFSNLSSRVSIYSSSDDYSGEYMTNPTVPEEYTGVVHADVNIGKHVIVGAGSVLLPGVIIEEGVSIGALSLIKERCSKFEIYAGNPAKRIGRRSKKLLDHEKDFTTSQL